MSDRAKCGTKTVHVHRVEFAPAPVDHNYDWLELVIDGETYEMSGQDAQILAQYLCRAQDISVTLNPEVRKTA